jgi:hypothetical protein
VLDEGHFQVDHGAIKLSESDPFSKSMLKMITVANFNSGQHIALWMNIQPRLSDSSLSADDVENGGQLRIRDSLTFRFIGGKHC